MTFSLLAAGSQAATTQQDLTHGFQNPPNSAKPRVYWWWLMSLVSKEGITKDLEEMAAKGIGGVLIFDCAGVGMPMPAAPSFMSPGWRENFRHALHEADRLGLEVSVNLCSGWDAGGPWITPDHASKHFQQSELIADASLPPEKRLTMTSQRFDPKASLLNSGLLGPVTVQTAQ